MKSSPLPCSSGETVTSSSSSSSSSPRAQRKDTRQKTDRRVTVTPPKLPKEPPPHIPAKGKVIFEVRMSCLEEIKFFRGYLHIRCFALQPFFGLWPFKIKHNLLMTPHHSVNVSYEQLNKRFFLRLSQILWFLWGLDQAINIFHTLNCILIWTTKIRCFPC